MADKRDKGLSLKQVLKQQNYYGSGEEFDLQENENAKRFIKKLTW